MRWLRRADPEFHQLVASEIWRVIAVDSTSSWVSTLVRGYYTGFPAVERRNTLYLACRLVWAASLIRRQRRRPWRWWGAGRLAARNAAKTTERRFMRSLPELPESDQWIEFLDGHGA